MTGSSTVNAAPSPRGAAELATVVQPFRRLEGSRSRDTGGSGLGLAIADQLAHALGGTLCLQNREGGGLTARLSLPCRSG